ncbi:MAG: amidoligase family protein [Clostridium butyricum]
MPYNLNSRGNCRISNRCNNFQQYRNLQNRPSHQEQTKEFKDTDILDESCINRNYTVSHNNFITFINGSIIENINGEYRAIAVRGNSRSRLSSIISSGVNTDTYGNHIIHFSNYKPNHFNYHKLTDKLFIGVELEVSFPAVSCMMSFANVKHIESAKQVLKYLGKKNCYIVADNSMNDGFEIVTHPCDLTYHKQLKYKKVFNILSEKGYVSNSDTECGLHVHVNRNFFTSNKEQQILGISKAIYLIDKYWDKIMILGRRKDDYYCKRIRFSNFLDTQENNHESISVVKCMYAYTQNLKLPKYTMVNFQHGDTFEFRLFCGTLDYNIYMATLEFVRNICYYCKDNSIETIYSADFYDIIDYLPTEYLSCCYNKFNNNGISNFKQYGCY